MAAPTQKDVEALSYEDLFNLYHLVKAELEKKRLVREAEMQLKDLTERYKAAVSDDPAKKLDSMAKGETVGPGQKLIIDGVEWTNSSGAFLSPHTAGPSQYPQGWQRTGARVQCVQGWAGFARAPDGEDRCAGRRWGGVW